MASESDLDLLFRQTKKPNYHGHYGLLINRLVCCYLVTLTDSGLNSPKFGLHSKQFRTVKIDEEHLIISEFENYNYSA